jgi:hypothetical protein
MASDPKATHPPGSSSLVRHREHGLRIFTYPKVIFMFPTLVTALICGFGMLLIGNTTTAPPRKINPPATAETTKADLPTAGKPEGLLKSRFMTSQNLMGVLFLGIFAFNLLIMAVDFPRFTIVSGVLVLLLLLFVLMWIAAYFDYDLMRPAETLFGRIYTVANAGFYFMFAFIVSVIFGVIYLTRYLDFWEIMPNEILHHHGPLSDLERYPTLNLKFDKEIPDVFEFLFLGAGRLVLHVTEERKAIVLDNVLFINHKEEELKKLMSRLEVRVTTDQEVADN